jgi:hypothetical protein
MMAYALSRSLLLSDELVIERAMASLKENNYKFGSLIETIVSSPQFLNRRIPDPAAQRSALNTRGE